MSTTKSVKFILPAFAAALLVASPAAAQKSEDTLRVAITDMFGGLDTYWFPHDEAGNFRRSVLEGLLKYDERARKFLPALAKSWKRIDPRTIEFTLRDDVKFHNGDAFDAEDVKYTIDYIIDPKTRLRFKGRYNWIEKVDILDPYKVRITAKAPRATDLSTIAYRFTFFDKDVHEKLEDKSTYGRVSPIGTGVHKVVSFDPRKGLTLERFDGHYDNGELSRAPIKRIEGIALPEQQTQLAQFFSGGIDVMRNPTADTSRELAKMPNAKITPFQSGQIIYLTMDKAGRSASKVMTDVRVRKAMALAIDREKIVRTLVSGGKVAEIPDGICFKVNVGCTVSVKPYGYDPEQAKKLLAAAGYPDGFDLEVKVHAPLAQIGEAVAGMLRDVGIRATTRNLPLSLYVKMRGKGEFTAFVGSYPTSAQPDVENLLNFFFGADRDYWNDPLIDQANKQGSTEFDEVKRGKVYEPALNKVNSEAYIYPIGELVQVWAHTADVKVMPNPASVLLIDFSDFAWAK